jgi:hypothetical protein
MNYSKKELEDLAKKAKDAGDFVALSEYNRILRLTSQETIVPRSRDYQSTPLLNPVEKRRLPSNLRAKLHAVLVAGTAQMKQGNIRAWKVMEAAERAALKGQEKILDGCLLKLGIIC